MSKIQRAVKAVQETTPAEVTQGPKQGRSFTYIGAGEDSPYVINFMGLQKFTRGVLTEVTDPEVFTKLSKGVPTFVEGPVDPEVIHQIDTEAKEKAAARRAEDLIINTRYNKKHRGE